MITRLYKGIMKREVITSRAVNPYSGNLKVIYWLESDKKGIMDTKWHDQDIERTWKKAYGRHAELVKRFMEDGWKEENGLTMEEALAAIRAAKAEDAPNGNKVVSPEHYVLKFKTSSAFKDHQMGRKANAENGRGKN